MIMRISTPDINPKTSMGATSTVDFEVRSEINNFSKNGIQNKNDKEDLKAQGIFVFYPAQNVQTESENETDEKEDDEKYETNTQPKQKHIDNNLIEKLADLNIRVDATDNEVKTESSSLTEEIKIKNELSSTEDNEEVASAYDKEVKPASSKEDVNSEAAKDVKNENNNNEIKKESEDEEDAKNDNLKQPNHKMNIPYDGVVESLDNLKINVKTEKAEVISRGPVRNCHSYVDYKVSTDPYPSFTSHVLQTGGCLIAQVPAAQMYDIQPQAKNVLNVESIFDEKDYLPDDFEKTFLSTCQKESQRDYRDEMKTQQQIVLEQQVPISSPLSIDDFNEILLLSKNFQLECPDVPDLNSGSQCLSPESNEDYSEQNLFSPPQYTQYPPSLISNSPSPLSVFTDGSSSCHSPSGYISSHSPDPSSESSLSSFSPPRQIPCEMQFPSLSTDVFTWPNKPLAPTNEKITNINDEVLCSNYDSGSSVNLIQIRQEPVIPVPENRSALERLNLDPEENRKAFRNFAFINDEKLSASDKDGDTMLLIMIAQKLPKGVEYLYALVKRLTKIPTALAARNFQGQSALLLACMYMYDRPLIARFIAESLLSVNYDLNEVYDNGNTIIHWLCERGDAYLNVLVELLSMKDKAGRPCFDINRHNHSTGTPLLVAVKAHGQQNLNCSGIIAFLLSLGANVTETERCGGQTSLHIAIKESGDPLIVQILLKAAAKQGKSIVDCTDYPKDTALHYAHLRNDLPPQQQLRIITLLLQYGAQNRTGSQGRMPLALVVPAERKEYIRANTLRRNRRT